MRTLLLVVALLGPIETVDRAVQEWSQRARAPWLEGTMRTATRAGTPVVVLGGLLAIALLDPLEGVALGRVALLTLAPTNLVVEGLKRLTQRTRPDGERDRANSSFPSSHAANAFALAMVLARRWRKAAIPCVLLAALIGASRIYLNRHFASDVLVGVVIGLVCAAWAMRVMRWPGTHALKAPTPHK